jgi:hypothetical protein
LGDLTSGDGLAAETTRAGANLLAQLHTLCSGPTAGELENFDRVARAMGKQVLRRRYHELRPHVDRCRRKSAKRSDISERATPRDPRPTDFRVTS